MQETNRPYAVPSGRGYRRTRKRASVANFTLLQRILIANLVIITTGSIIGSWLTAQLAEAGSFNPVTFAVIIACAALLSGSISFFMLKLAFRPFEELQQVLAKIHSGSPRARQALQRITDPDIRHFATALNQMLVRLEDNARIIQEDQRQLQKLTARVINAQESERKRIARELHDEASQSLTAIIMGLDAANRQAQDEKMQRKLETLRDMATGTLEELRKLALDLRPTMLDDLGLVPAVQWLSRNAAERAGFKIQLDLDKWNNGERLSPEIETCLFRITQESLTNIVKHADASQVNLSLVRLADQNVKLVIKDNGKGFDRQQARQMAICTGHLGLFDIEERALMVGGYTEIKSGTGGTTITVTVPEKPRPSAVSDLGFNEMFHTFSCPRTE